MNIFNIRILVAVAAILTGFYFYDAIIINDQSSQRYPWPVKIVGIYILYFLSIKCVEDGTDNWHKYVGYLFVILMILVIGYELILYIFFAENIFGRIDKIFHYNNLIATEPKN